jgi:hypothetical protein
MPAPKRLRSRFIASVLSSLIETIVVMAFKQGTALLELVRDFRASAAQHGGFFAAVERHWDVLSNYLLIFSGIFLVFLTLFHLGVYLLDIYRKVRYRLDLGNVAQLAGLTRAFADTYRNGDRKADLYQDIINTAHTAHEKEFKFVGASGQAFALRNAALHCLLEDEELAMRVALMDPHIENIQALRIRSRQAGINDNANTKTYRQQIVDFMHLLKNRKNHLVHVHLFQKLPKWRIFSVDGVIWAQHYLPNRAPDETPAFKFVRDKIVHDAHKNSLHDYIKNERDFFLGNDTEIDLDNWYCPPDLYPHDFKVCRRTSPNIYYLPAVKVAIADRRK